MSRCTHPLLSALAGSLLVLSSSAMAERGADFTNTLGMRFVRIPAGSFLMGSDELPETLARDFPQYDRSRFDQLGDESPRHPVRISRDFLIGQHEVTVGQFHEFLERSGHVPESIADGTGGYGYNPDYDPATTARGDAFEGRNPRYSWRNPGFVQSDDHPVVNVTWNDAQALAHWLSKQEQVRYRLPTEAEWEYACRAGTDTRYFSGDAPESLATVANIFDADAAPFWRRWQAYALNHADGYAFTAPVGSHRANAFGVFDLIGNVWEWTADWHGDTAYANAPASDPTGPAVGSVRVRRGGSWHTWAFYARCSFRNWNTPQSRYPLVGIRLVREIPPAR